MTKIVVGEIKRFVSSERGGFWLIWSEEGRFRAYPSQFRTQPTLGEIVSFLPDPKSSGDARRVTTVLFQEPAEINSGSEKVSTDE